MTSRQARAGRLDPAGVFVVRVRERNDASGEVSGRIEHVASGREARFDTGAGLLALLTDWLEAESSVSPRSDRPGE